MQHLSLITAVLGSLFLILGVAVTNTTLIAVGIYTMLFSLPLVVISAAFTPELDVTTTI